VKVLDLISFIKARVDGTYYPNSFPVAMHSAPDTCSVVRITGGYPTDEWTGKKQPAFQILVRGNVGNPAEVETRAYAIHDSLANIHDVTIGNESVVIIRCTNSVPFYIGTDDNNRPIYSCNFECVIRP
jgi:hypothetical protein